MTNLTTLFYIVIIATVARPLEADTLSSRPSKMSQTPPVVPAKLIENASILIKKIDPVIKLKRQNDATNLLNTDGLFDELASAADAVQEELLDKEFERTDKLRSMLEKREMAECQGMFEKWQESGNSLWTLYRKCHVNEEKKAAMYKAQILNTTHVIDKLENYLSELSTCVGKNEFTSGPRSHICTTLVSVELPSYYDTVRSDVVTYSLASKELQSLINRISGDGQCGGGDMKKKFFDGSKTIIAKIKCCIDRHSKNART